MIELGNFEIIIKVDGKKIKENTFYILRDRKFIETEGNKQEGKNK